MAIHGTMRPGLIQLKVLDLDKTLDFYKNILGLDEVGRTSDGRVMLKCYDEFDHHSVVLRMDKTAGLDYVGFKVTNAQELEDIKAKTEKFGYQVTEVAPDTEQPGFGKQYKFKLCTGHEFHIYADVKMAEKHPQIKNPDIWNELPRGMRAVRLDHFLLYGPGIEEAERFMKEVFDMFVPEICNTPDGKRLATWITGNNKPHDLAFVEYPKPNTIHHIGFYLQTWEDILNA
ncbi:MAG: VOC family protein, partial [Treponema sp.]|nr:VOC family protein [Treponema sp.]